MKHTQPMLSHINVGSGVEITIQKLAEVIAGVTDYKGTMIFDKTRPDGAPRKLMDSSRLKNLGWQPTMSLEEGLSLSYNDFLNTTN